MSTADGIEWAVRWPLDETDTDPDPEDPIERHDAEGTARIVAKKYAGQGATLVSRTVTRSPWTETS